MPTGVFPRYLEHLKSLKFIEMSQASSDGTEGSIEPSLPKASKIKKPPQKIKKCSSSLSSKDLVSLIKTFPCLAQYHPTLPDEHEKPYPPPSGKVALFKAYLTSSALRLPFTHFYLSVLRYFKVGVSQLHPFAVGKIVRFEMLSKALGRRPSLYIFRKIFLLCRSGDIFTFLYRDKDFKLIETPSKLPGWRFYYFFVDSSFIPDDMREILCLGKQGYSSAEIAKINKKVADKMIDRNYYKMLRANCIPYCSIPPRLEGVLAMVGLSPSWDWNTVPVLIKKSTGERMISYPLLLF